VSVCVSGLSSHNFTFLRQTIYRYCFLAWEHTAPKCTSHSTKKHYMNRFLNNFSSSFQMASWVASQWSIISSRTLFWGKLLLKWEILTNIHNSGQFPWRIRYSNTVKQCFGSGNCMSRWADCRKIVIYCITFLLRLFVNLKLANKSNYNNTKIPLFYKYLGKQ
jgi:hypothetical protein